MTQSPQNNTQPNANTTQKIPIVTQICDIIEVWQLIKEYGCKPTCGEEMGWPDWRQWF